MLEKMHSILEGNDLCVLATIASGKPHCSLMSYILDSARTRLFMATLQDTRKFRNIIANPNVSLLVDTRTAHRSSQENLQALTIWGRCSPIEEDGERRGLLEDLSARHPRLRELVRHPGAQVLAVQIDAFLLLDGVLEGRFQEL